MIIRPARPNEYEAVIDLVQRTFPPGDEAWVLTAVSINDDPAFRAEHLRVAERNGQIIGIVNLIDRQVHIGSATVRCAIVAPLATEPEHQGTGVGSALMRDMLDWAARNGFLLSMLWGHPWLYPRYGYGPGIKSYKVTLPADATPFGDTAYTCRPYTTNDVLALQEVYNTEMARTTLAEVRSDAPWEWRPYNPGTSITVAVDPARLVRGYVRLTQGQDRLSAGEINALDLGAARALYDYLLRQAREHQVASVDVTATPDNRWSRLALMQGAQVCVSSGGGAGMVRVLDTAAFLRAIQPELQRRVAQSEYIAQRADVQLETPVGSATIRIDRGNVMIDQQRVANTITLPFHALNALVTGYQPIGEVLGLPGVHMRGDNTERLLDVLFPEGYPHWSFAAYFS